MKRKRMKNADWEPIRNQAIEAAQMLGHKLGPFERSPKSGFMGNQVKTAMCDNCYGCCWVAYSVTRGFGAGGRLLKYRCGTPEAMGLLRADPEAAA